MLKYGFWNWKLFLETTDVVKARCDRNVFKKLSCFRSMNLNELFTKVIHATLCSQQVCHHIANVLNCLVTPKIIKILRMIDMINRSKKDRPHIHVPCQVRSALGALLLWHLLPFQTQPDARTLHLIRQDPSKHSNLDLQGVLDQRRWRFLQLTFCQSVVPHPLSQTFHWCEDQSNTLWSQVHTCPAYTGKKLGVTTKHLWLFLGPFFLKTKGIQWFDHCMQVIETYCSYLSKWIG